MPAVLGSRLDLSLDSRTLNPPPDKECGQALICTTCQTPTYLTVKISRLWNKYNTHKGSILPPLVHRMNRSWKVTFGMPLQTLMMNLPNGLSCLSFGPERKCNVYWTHIVHTGELGWIS